jgi:hypothetical protein
MPIVREHGIRRRNARLASGSSHHLLAWGHWRPMDLWLGANHQVQAGCFRKCCSFTTSQVPKPRVENLL